MGIVIRNGKEIQIARFLASSRTSSTELSPSLNFEWQCKSPFSQMRPLRNGPGLVFRLLGAGLVGEARATFADFRLIH